MFESVTLTATNSYCDAGKWDGSIGRIRVSGADTLMGACAVVTGCVVALPGDACVAVNTIANPSATNATTASIASAALPNLPTRRTRTMSVFIDVRSSLLSRMSGLARLTQVPQSPQLLTFSSAELAVTSARQKVSHTGLPCCNMLALGDGIATLRITPIASHHHHQAAPIPGYRSQSSGIAAPPNVGSLHCSVSGRWKRLPRSYGTLSLLLPILLVDSSILF